MSNTNLQIIRTSYASKSKHESFNFVQIAIATAYTGLLTPKSYIKQMKKGMNTNMNIESMPLSTNQPVNSITIGLAVLAKNLSTIETAGQNMIKMMEQSIQPNLGNRVDIRV